MEARTAYVAVLDDRVVGVAVVDLREARFVLEHRFATWALRPWCDDADVAVSVLRLPARGRGSLQAP